MRNVTPKGSRPRPVRRYREIVACLLAAACAPRPTQPPVEPAPPDAPSSAAPPVATDDVSLAENLGRGIVAVCLPAPGEPAAAARRRCAEGLTDLVLLRDRLRDPTLWGVQAPSAGYAALDSRTTQMNARVLRRLYLSTFAFGPNYRAEPTPAGAVLHVASRFHAELDPGDYPYPFWHSPDKWKSYERTRELLFIIEHGAIVAVLRSKEQDAERLHVERPWDGQWRWQSQRGEEPQNALYTSLFSAQNPHVAALDTAYRAFEQAQRETRCLSCHDPANSAKANPLELFSYPNQALAGRHDIVSELEKNAMPPGTPEVAAGVADDAQRRELLALAERFAQLGDEALRFEGEPVR